VCAKVRDKVLRHLRIVLRIDAKGRPRPQHRHQISVGAKLRARFFLTCRRCDDESWREPERGLGGKGESAAKLASELPDEESAILTLSR